MPHFLKSLIPGRRGHGLKSDSYDKSLLSRIGWSHSDANAARSWHSPPEAAQSSTPEGVLQGFASLPVDAALEHLQSGIAGLSNDEAAARLKFKGPNTMRSQKPPSRIMLLIKVIPNPFNLLLLALAIINASLPTPDWVRFDSSINIWYIRVLMHRYIYFNQRLLTI